MKSVLWLLAASIIGFNASGAIAAKHVKVAVLDCLQSQKFASEQYEKDYFSGIDAAIDQAKSKGIDIAYKPFLYGKGDLDILREIPKIKKWNPDVIIGPRSSNKFLLVRDQFTNVLVFSPLATASDVTTMPENFYSFTLPNKFEAKAMAQVFKRKFSGHGIFEIIESDCANCSDMARLFEDEIKDMMPHAIIGKSKFLNNQAETISLKGLLSGYKAGDVVLLADTSYTSGVLSARIADYLIRDDVVFLGNDEWGSWKAGYFGKVKSKFDYKGIRVIPWSLDGHSIDKGQCEKAFQKKFAQPLPDVISLVSCHIINVIAASAQTVKPNQSMRQGLLMTFQKKHKADPFWQKSKRYAVHEISQHGERFLEDIDALGDTNETE